MKTIKLSAALALALTAALLAADASSASSIVFAKGGNVWRSSPDGRHQARLTRDGGYSSPSQDDRGRVWAVQRGRFVRLSRGGRRVGAPFSAAVGRSGNVTAYGPWEAQVSPNGSRIAYWRGIQRLDAPVGGMTPYDLEDQVVVSRSDRFTSDSTFGYQRDYRDPSWIGNRELLVFNYGLGVEEAAFFAPRPAGDPSFGQWFSDPDVAQIGDGELSRDARTLVVGAGGGLDLNNLALYQMATFSPRGNAIAFAQDAPGRRADGLYVWSFGNCSGKAKLIARGAVDPDWGPR
jgi:hypothetical protein